MKKIPEIFMYALGALVVLCFFLLMMFLVKFEIPESNEKVLYLVVGAIIGSFNQVVGYFYGSSKGSKDKTEHLAKRSESQALG